MAPCRAILNRLRLGVRLVPHDIGSQIPAVFLERKRQPPRNAEEILRFQSFRCWWPITHATGLILLVDVSPCAVAARESVSDVKPHRAVVCKCSPDFSKDHTKVLQVFRQLGFGADLIQHAVVTEAPIGRTGYATAERTIRYPTKDVPSITQDDLRLLHRRTSQRPHLDSVDAKYTDVRTFGSSSPSSPPTAPPTLPAPRSISTAAI